MEKNYNYCLFKSTPSGYEVTLNEREEPIKERHPFTSGFNIAYGIWKSSCITLPIDESEADKVINYLVLEGYDIELPNIEIQVTCLTAIEDKVVFVNPEQKEEVNEILRLKEKICSDNLPDKYYDGLLRSYQKGKN